MTQEAIGLSQLEFSYEDLLILKQNELHIAANQWVGIIGPNGGGKTTFLKLLMGFLKPDRGKIEIFGKSPKQRTANIGYVPQFHRSDREFPITVLELVLLGSLNHLSWMGTYPKIVQEKALQLLEEFGLQNYRNASFGSLSGGLAQRALLARALLADPEILLLDEPTANVDLQTTDVILNQLSLLKGQKTILLVSHDLNTIVQRVDQILCIEKEITTYLPEEICSHFAMGLYHTPLLKLQPQESR